MKLLAIIKDTFRELLARKVIIGFLIFNVLALAGVGIFINTGTIDKIAAAQKSTITPELYNAIAYSIEAGVVGFFYVFLIFISLFSAASVIPSALEKGTIDIYLSKPVARWELLCGKIIGSIGVVGANIGVFMLGAWVILSLKLGFWNPGFLAAAVVMLFAFTVLYSVIVVLNVATRSATPGIITTYVHFLLLSGILANRSTIFSFVESGFLRGMIDWIYYILPQTSEHSVIATAYIVHSAIPSWLPIWDSGIFAIAMFACAGWIFRKKDF